MRLFATGMALLAAVVVAQPIQAELQVRGKGKKQVLLPSQFRGERATRYRLFAKKCTKCHEMARPIVALRTGITPVTGGKFDRQGMKAYVVKMMRKPNSGIRRDEAREVLKFLWYARSLAQADE